MSLKVYRTKLDNKHYYWQMPNGRGWNATKGAVGWYTVWRDGVSMRNGDRFNLLTEVETYITRRENDMNTTETTPPGSLHPVVRRRECPHCHESLERYEDPKAVEIIGTLENEIADNERWMREVLTDFRIPFDDHKIGRRLAFTQWMFERQSPNAPDQRPGAK